MQFNVCVQMCKILGEKQNTRKPNLYKEIMNIRVALNRKWFSPRQLKEEDCWQPCMQLNDFYMCSLSKHVKWSGRYYNKRWMITKNPGNEMILSHFFLPFARYILINFQVFLLSSILRKRLAPFFPLKVACLDMTFRTNNIVA